MKIPENEVPGPKRDYVGYGRNVPKVVWPGEARVAINIVINRQIQYPNAPPILRRRTSLGVL